MLTIRFIVTLLVAFQWLSGRGTAQTGRDVYVPLTFHADSGAVRTTACLQVKEHRYGDAKWWVGQQAPGTPGAAVKAVLSAIDGRDRQALQSLSASAQVNNKLDFEQQASAYVEQARRFRIASIPWAYEFDGLFAFFAIIEEANGRSGLAPFVFAVDNKGFRFLPNRSELGPSYLIVRDWLAAPWGPRTSADASYCGLDAIKRATHKEALVGTGTYPSTLLLQGSKLETTRAMSASWASVKTVDDALKSAAAKSMEAVSGLMTPQGAQRLMRWSANATEAERGRYTDALMRSTPVFLFDLGTVLVVYSIESDSRGFQVLYFTRTADNVLQWTNATRATSADKVFKSGTVFRAVQLQVAGK